MPLNKGYIDAAFSQFGIATAIQNKFNSKLATELVAEININELLPRPENITKIDNSWFIFIDAIEIDQKAPLTEKNNRRAIIF